jgi:hypothetical protein
MAVTATDCLKDREYMTNPRIRDFSILFIPQAGSAPFGKNAKKMSKRGHRERE